MQFDPFLARKFRVDRGAPVVGTLDGLVGFFFSAVALGFLLTEDGLIGGKVKCWSVGREIKRGLTP